MKRSFLAVLAAACAIAFVGAASAEVVEVSNGAELYAALRNERAKTIKLAPGVYDITKIPEAFQVEGDDELYGTAYRLDEIDGLEIIGAGRDKTKIVLSDPELTVMSLWGCRNIRISGMTFGHVPIGNEYGCAGNVLDLYDCMGVELEDVDMFGCGVTGLTMYECKGVSVKGSIIRDCSDALLYISECRDVVFKDTRFRHRDDAESAAFSMWTLDGSPTTFDGCDFAVPQWNFIQQGAENDATRSAAFIGATFYGGPRAEDLESIVADDPSVSFTGSIFKGADEPGVEDHFGGPDPNGTM